MSSCYDLKFNPIMEPEQITYREDVRKRSIFRLKTIFPVIEWIVPHFMHKILLKFHISCTKYRRLFVMLHSFRLEEHAACFLVNPLAPVELVIVLLGEQLLCNDISFIGVGECISCTLKKVLCLVQREF